MSNAKTAQLIGEALKSQAEQTAAFINSAVQGLGMAVAKDIVDLKQRVAALEQKAVAPAAEKMGEPSVSSPCQETGTSA